MKSCIHAPSGGWITPTHIFMSLNNTHYAAHIKIDCENGRGYSFWSDTIHIRICEFATVSSCNFIILSNDIIKVLLRYRSVEKKILKRYDHSIAILCVIHSHMICSRDEHFLDNILYDIIYSFAIYNYYYRFPIKTNNGLIILRLVDKTLVHALGDADIRSPRGGTWSLLVQLKARKKIFRGWERVELMDCFMEKI